MFKNGQSLRWKIYILSTLTNSFSLSDAIIIDVLKFLLFPEQFPSWATWQMYATSRQVDGATFYQLRWISCDDGHLADDSDDDKQKYKQNYGTHTSSFGPCLWLWWQQYFFLHGKDTFCSKLIQLQIQTNKKIITKAKRPPAVCVVLHIQVQLLDKCYD